ncbi:DUF499 domain-containing protein [Microbacterium maritypicum]|uniref:DUF499 domain-containing protein n=1 Tax=Microbacterium maritypicum TaxID=33918 RepID=A0ACD4B316_MICMQ|nr:DUF499 domain-containing protein [Microbacterium liquefaciens]UTT52007.1 DUF499 domain-containing protein [Microbacterium liquefaciens]
MAMNNQERLFKAFGLLAEGLYDTVDEVMTASFGTADWNTEWSLEDATKRSRPAQQMDKTDVQVQLRAITEKGYDFKEVLSRAQQGYGSELKDFRNDVMHGKPVSSDDTARALDTMERLLQAVGAVDSAKDVHGLRQDLQRTVYEDQTRKQVKRVASVTASDQGQGLRPWREVIRPHDDVARGEFTASEFAADLHFVHTGQAVGTEYSDPIEFFTRTYLTEGLRDLLSRALRRMNGSTDASPVVNLQTNFGGGKTHSMLALYHLFSGTPAHRFPDELQKLIASTGSENLETLLVKRVALVGTYLKAGSPIVKDDGTEVRTLWGELAWQLGGREAFDQIAADDAAGTNPGDALRTLFQTYGPALILIDEWVAYARQLVTDKELPAGSFETQFTFAQSLTEIVKSVPGIMLVVSIPASDTGSADIEIGGANGQLALERLQNVIRRVADQWRPSSKDESFEIVRRRLFQAPDAAGLTAVATTARSFVTMYRNNLDLFPRDATVPGLEYEDRIKSSYPLHPELLDRLYEDWSTLERFQRTRGVLKLVSSIVHELWVSEDAAPLIMPGYVPLDASTVNTDLTQYLEDQWKPIIDSDIDGAASTAAAIDKSRPTLQERHVTQRIARTIFMGAAPRSKSSRKGLDKQYVWLGTGTPGDTLGNFGSAIDLLGQKSTYFYEEQGHYWFDTQPSVTKTASDYAERLREDVETVWNEIVKRLDVEQRTRGQFDRVHVAPESSADIPDLENTRLVIVHPRHSRLKNSGDDAAAHQWVRAAIEQKGASQRIHRNTLVFLVADKNELELLEGATRTYLGWKRVQATSDTLNLSAQQRKQTDDQVARFNQTVTDRIRDTYGWAMYPEQFDATKAFSLGVDKVPDKSGNSLAQKVSAKLSRDDLMITELGAAILGETLQDQLGELWRDKGEVTVGEVWGYFTRYPYMLRLVNRDVLDRAIANAVDTVLVDSERFAIARGKDESTGRYLDLVLPPKSGASIQVTDATLLVESSKAEAQITADREQQRQREVAAAQTSTDGDSSSQSSSASQSADGVGGIGPVDFTFTDHGRDGSGSSGTESALEALLVRYFGSVTVSAERYSRDIGNVTREVIDRLAGTGAELEITIDIQARKSSGFDESERRIISENASTLKFKDSTFEN